MAKLVLKSTAATTQLGQQAVAVSLRVIVRAHVKIMRLDHSIKNIFILPGVVVAFSLQLPNHRQLRMSPIALGVIAVTLIACSNYVLNEVLDAPFDRFHPQKSSRPAALGLINTPLAYVQWLLLGSVGMMLALTVDRPFAACSAALWVMGCAYNIRPLRTKDVAYLDVLTESINNPLRMLLGWYMVTATIVPPASMLCAYWMLGCFFMGLKRFSEFRQIGSKQVAIAYRNSFRRYSERTLLGSVIFYASAAMLMFGAFIIRYRIELILSFPFIAVLMAMYFDLSFEHDSAVQHPEKLYRQPALMAIVVVTFLSMVILLNLHIPLIGRIFTSSTW